MTATRIHEVERNGRFITAFLYGGGKAAVISFEKSSITGKRIARRGRQTIGHFDSHAKAMFAWAKASAR